MYCLVTTFNKSFDDIWLIYFVPDYLSCEIKVWNIVNIPYWKEIEIALVLKLNISLWNIDESKIKSIISIKNNNIFLNEYQDKLIPWLAKYYITPIHSSANLFFPRNLLDKIKKDKIINFETKAEYNYNFEQNISFSKAQDITYKNIINSDNKKILLYGITWSGKTELYIKLIQEQLKNNKQSLLLIPEIILSNQVSNKIKEVFWNDVLIINSTVSAAKRTWYWMDIYTWKAKIIIWTRSAIFYPFNNLGTIIVDEEHDNSYVSDQSPRFHSLDLVNKISDYLDIPLLLASGTPSITSMYKSVKWEYKQITLLEKYKRPD
jgi:primosomal protein N' (replication factor Y)